MSFWLAEIYYNMIGQSSAVPHLIKVIISAPQRTSVRSAREQIQKRAQKKQMPRSSFVKSIVAGAAAVATVTVICASDGRFSPYPKLRQYALRTNTWKAVQKDPAFNEGWFQGNMRCSRKTFDSIAARIEDRWPAVFDLPRPNARFAVRDRVAVALYYLMHGCSAYAAGQKIGCGKSQALTYIKEVVLVLNTFKSSDISLPTTIDGWGQVERGFQQMCGFPGVVGALDGTLIRLQRFADFEGFYCRKGYPAFNMQAVVDHQQRFVSFSIRNGAQNDQSVFNRSVFGQTILSRFPEGKHCLGDAGYCLSSQVLTPYPITLTMTRRDSKYNYLHSRTRITVEQAFGRLKGIFRIYKHPLQQDTPEYMSMIVVATLVLHNWLIDLKQKVSSKKQSAWRRQAWQRAREANNIHEDEDDPTAFVLRDRLRDKLYRHH